MIWSRLRCRLATGLVCALLGACAPGSAVLQDRRDQVRSELDALQRDLSRNDWGRVERFFSPGYQAGYGELRDRIESGGRRERLIELQFLVGRVMERDGLVNAEVRWNKSFLDAKGRPGKRSGVSEIILRPVGEGFQIVNVRGDQFF